MSAWIFVHKKAIFKCHVCSQSLDDSESSLELFRRDRTTTLVTVSWQSYGMCILAALEIWSIDHLEKSFKWPLWFVWRRKSTALCIKVIFNQDNAPFNRPMTTMAKIHDLHLELLPPALYSPDLATFTYSKTLQKIITWKIFVISKTEVYFAAKDLFFYKAIQILEKCWNYNIALQGN